MERSGPSRFFNQRMILAMAFLVGAFLFAFFVWGPSFGSRIHQGSYKKISVGMTDAEVEALLGGRSEEIGNLQDRYFLVDGTEPTVSNLTSLFEIVGYGAPGRAKVTPVSPEGEVAIWRSADYAIALEFDRDRRVAFKALGQAKREPGLWSWVRQSLKVGR